MGIGDIDMLNEVSIAGRTALQAYPTPVLRTEFRQRSTLDIAQMGNRNDLVLIGIEIFRIEFVFGQRDFRPARIPVFLFQLTGLFLDDAELLVDAGKDFVAAGDELHQFVILVLQALALESDELAQTHIDDFRSLDVGKIIPLDQHLLRLLDAPRFIPDNMDDLVDDIHRLEETFEDMGALFRFFQFEFRPADDYFMTEFHEILEDFLQAEGARTSLDEGDVIEGETGLERRILIKHIQQDIGIHALLKADNHAGFTAGRFVIDIGDALDPLVFDHLGNLLDHFPLIDHIRDFGHDDRLPTLFIDLDFRLGADDYAAAAGLIGFLDARTSHDDAAGREIRTLDILHQFIGRYLGVVNIGADRIAALAQVVRGHVRGHTDRDTGSTVQQQERGLCRNDRRFFEGIIEVQGHVDRILVHVAEDIFSHLLQLSLRITHGCRGVSVHGAEVALSLDERVALVPFLAEADHRIVDAGVAVGMELTHDLTHDSGGFLCLTGETQAHRIHTEKDPPLHRFQTVTDIRQST